MIAVQINQSPGGSWRAEPQDDGPVHVYVPCISFTEWQNRYCVGAAASGSICCAIVIDRGVKKNVLDEDKNIVKDKRGFPVFQYINRALVACAYNNQAPGEFVDLLWRICLYYRSACLCVVANQVGQAIIGTIQKHKNREAVRLYIRTGKQDEIGGIPFQDRYGYALGDNREAFFVALASWIDADDGFKCDSRSVLRSCYSVTRSESGRLSVDVQPDTIKAFAMAAAIHASIQAQEANRTPQEAPLAGRDYTSKVKYLPLKGEGAWWGYGLGLG